VVWIGICLVVCTNKLSLLLKKFWIPSLFAGVIFISMTKQYSLDQIPNMLMIDAWRLPYTTVFSTVLDRGILVLGLQKYICTITTPEIGAYMLFVQVWNPRWLSVHWMKLLLGWISKQVLIDLQNYHMISLFVYIRYSHNIISMKLARRRLLLSIFMRRFVYLLCLVAKLCFTF